MSTIQQVEVNNVTIEVGTGFKLQSRSEQLAESIIETVDDIHSNDAGEIADELVGKTLTVANITRDPSGTHFEFTTVLNENTPVSIMQFAVENMLQDNDLVPN
jgi:hypothetical protein